MNDLRFGLRMLAKNPGFTAVAVLTLALCLGANLTIFAVVDSILLRPLPFPEADRLVAVFNRYPKAGMDRAGASFPNYYNRRGNIAAFSSVSAFKYDMATIGEAGSTEREEVLRVSPEFFETLGVGPVMGRAFTEAEMDPLTDSAAVLTDAYWRRHFNADPDVLGQEMRVDGFLKTIVGVLPAGFRFLSSEARICLPLSSPMGEREIGSLHDSFDCQMNARLKPGATLGEAQAQVDAHNAARQPGFPYASMVADAGFHTTVAPLHADHVASIRHTLLLLQGGVLFLLLIGGVNLVNLLLIRASGRVKEMAIRQSLGASGWNVVKQVMAETVSLTVIGGICGLAVGAGGIRLVAALGANQLPLGAHVAFDGRVALVALVGALAMGCAIALPIAWFNLRVRLANTLQTESRSGTTSLAAQRLRHSFIVAQIALAFVLLSGASLLGLSLKRAWAVSPGFRPDHVLTGHLALPATAYGDLSARLAFAARLLEEAGRQPGVLAAGMINQVPVSGKGRSTNRRVMTVAGYLPQPGVPPAVHYVGGVLGDYFAAMGIPLREGRFLESADSLHEERVCVVDEDFARRYWPQGSAIGQRVFDGTIEEGEQPFTVVGVVGAVKQTELTEARSDGAIYFSHRDAPVDTLNLFIVTRTSQPPRSFGSSLQKVVRSIDPALPVDDLRSMEVRIADSLVARRSPAMLTAIFAGVALLLAGIGTYGVLSYAVAQQRREIGVRIALGAVPKQIGRQFLSLGLRLLAVGVILGVCGAWAAGRAMQSLLFDVPSLHVATLAGTAVLMSVVSLVACLLPALRASHVDPMEALRHE